MQVAPTGKVWLATRVHLYSGATVDFVADATQSRIAGKLAESFLEHFRYQAPQSEVRSWQNSLRAMANVVQLGWR